MRSFLTSLRSVYLPVSLLAGLLALSGCASAPAAQNSVSVDKKPQVLLLVGLYRYTPNETAKPTVLEDLVQGIDSNAEVSQAANGDLYAAVKAGEDIQQGIWRTLSQAGRVDVIADTKMVTLVGATATLSSHEDTTNPVNGADPSSYSSLGFSLSVKVGALTPDTVMLDVDGRITGKPSEESDPTVWSTQGHSMLVLNHTAVIGSREFQPGNSADGHEASAYYLISITPIVSRG